MIEHKSIWSFRWNYPFWGPVILEVVLENVCRPLSVPTIAVKRPNPL